ncbi:MAG: carbohydrate ABC transporter permease [Lachnospiraceae bacterium]|nr:carbohydrate ABC transporter permease [Lachnospiraceae bacterium]HAV00171.1 carbohydrate ABC transporter permease [Lachnospiraceae bacterium]
MPEIQAVKNESAGKKVGNTILGIFLNVLMWVFSLSCIFPLIWMGYSSLKQKRDFNKDIFSLPSEPSLSNYQRILSNPDYNIASSMWNSARTTVISVFLIVICAFIVGYILSRCSFKLNRPLYIMFLMGMLIPVHSLMVPIYIIFSRANLLNKWYTLLMPYLCFNLPVSLFLVEGYVKGIPTALEEAAAIDGCSFTRSMFSIILPICKPILTTVAIINVFGCWNEFSFALILQSKAYQTVPLALKNFTGQFNSDFPKMMAAMLLTMSPVVLFYFIFSKQIIKGMVAGAVKG